MKANELMVGDLICQKGYPEFPLHVSEILTTFIWCEESFGVDGIIPNRESAIDLDDVRPIPLTEEILKANGFKKLDLTIGNYALKLEEKEKYDIHTILWGGVFNGRMEFKVICEYIHIDKKIRYVHELQHALRLCGWKDLADNFKVKEEEQ